jgi:hypothetical protein
MVEVMGIYASKEIAARVAGSLDTDSWGTFEEALDEFEKNYDDATVIDNRLDPPNNGVLLQVGSEDEGEGDYSLLEISRMPIVAKTDLQIKERKTQRDDSESDNDNSDTEIDGSIVCF